MGWEPTAVLGGGLLHSSLTPTPPTHVHLGAGLPGLNDTGHSDIVLMFDGEIKRKKNQKKIAKPSTSAIFQTKTTVIHRYQITM